MKFIVRDQHGVPLPVLTRVMRDHAEIFEPYATAVNGEVAFSVLDNQLAGVTCEEAAIALDLEPATIRDLCLHGSVRAKRYPMRWRIPKRELKRYQAARGGDACD